MHPQRVVRAVARRDGQARADELGTAVVVPRQDVGDAGRGQADPAHRAGGGRTHESTTRSAAASAVAVSPR